MSVSERCRVVVKNIMTLDDIERKRERLEKGGFDSREIGLF